MDIDQRHAQWDAICDVLLCAQRRLARCDQRHVETGPAHVAGDEIGMAGLHADPRRGDRSGGRTGHDGVYGEIGGHAGRHHAAIPLHDEKIVGQPRTAQVLGETAEITRHDRLHVAVERCRAAALEFTHLAQYLATQGHKPIGPDFPRNFGAALLMRWVGVGMDEMDYQRLGAVLEQAVHGLPHCRVVKRRQDPAGGIDALGHLGPEVARDQRLEAPGHPVRIGASAATQFEHIAKACRGNQAATRPLALEHGVGGDSRAVNQRGYRSEIGFEHRQPGDEADRLVLGGRRHLGDAEHAALRIERQQVRERAADIDPDLPCHPLFLAVLPRFSLTHADQRSRSCCASGGASFRFMRPS